MITTEPVEFFMVWTKNGWPPKRQHATEIEALMEARRLAVAYPGKKFIVLRATAKVSTPASDEAALRADVSELLEINVGLNAEIQQLKGTK